MLAITPSNAADFEDKHGDVDCRPVLVPGFKYNGTPILLSEFGGIAYIAPGSNVPGDAWGYAGVEKNQESALARLRSIYEGIAKIPEFVGICYTQLTDVEQEIIELLRAGAENLDIIQWARRTKSPTDQATVSCLLTQIDINSRRLCCHFAATQTKPSHEN